MTRIEPVGALGEAMPVKCARCIKPATTFRNVWDAKWREWDESDLCDQHAEEYDANQEPGDSFYECFYEGRG